MCFWFNVSYTPSIIHFRLKRLLKVVNDREGYDIVFVLLNYIALFMY